SVSGAESAVPRSTSEPERSVTGRGATWTGTRSASAPSGVTSSQPAMLDTKSRGSGPITLTSGSCVGSGTRCRVAGSSVTSTVTSLVWPAGTLTEAGRTVTASSPGVAPTKAVEYVWADDARLRTVTVSRSVTVSAPTSTTPKDSETPAGRSGA